MVQAKYRAAGRVICKYQQIIIREDEITLHLLKTNKHNKSGFYQRYKTSLKILELEHLKGRIQDQGTEALKIEIKEKIAIIQRKETLQHIRTRITPHYEKHNKEWAPEHYLTENWPGKHKLAYLHLRTFSHHIKATKESRLCPACRKEAQTPSHLLVKCDALKASRTALIKEIKTISTYTYLKLQKSTDTEKTAIILGKKPRKLKTEEWKKLQPAFAKHTYRIQEKIMEML